MVLDMVVLKTLLGTSTTCSHRTHISVPKYCGCNLVVLDMVMLYNEYLVLTPHLLTLNTCECMFRSGEGVT